LTGGRRGRLTTWLGSTWLPLAGGRRSRLATCLRSAWLSLAKGRRSRLATWLNRRSRLATWLPLTGGRYDVPILLKIDDLAGRPGQRLAVPAHPPVTIGGGRDEAVPYRALLDQVSGDAVQV
jgi:hypothetical protein